MPTKMSQQTAVQFSHFALPMGSRAEASVVSLGTMSVRYSGCITELSRQWSSVIGALSSPALKVYVLLF